MIVEKNKKINPDSEEILTVKMELDRRGFSMSLSSSYYLDCSFRDSVKKYFPELRHLLKWCGIGLDMPTHYYDNTLYHAGDLDYNDLRKGEVLAYRYNVRVNGGLVFDENMPKFKLLEKEEAEEMAQRVGGEVVPVGWLLSEGKERNFDAARHSAIWPEATDEELSLPKAELLKLLEARLPALMDNFKKDMLEVFGGDAEEIFSQRG